jgi:hypothetical protein
MAPYCDMTQTHGSSIVALNVFAKALPSNGSGMFAYLALVA